MPDRDEIPSLWSTAIGLGFALCAFAGNSLLTRAALGPGLIDAASFTALRLGSGALFLVLIVRSRSRVVSLGGSWTSAMSLFLYAAAFSWAYRSLTAATGALLLFGAVQCTMLLASLLRHEAPSAWQWVGFAVSATGLVALLIPGVQSPDAVAGGVMLLAGVSWGLYSLRGVSSAEPLATTAGNFLRAAPLPIAWMVMTLTESRLSVAGALLALTSGALTSGLGYVAWYRVLPRLGSFRASIAQLAVPGLAALAGALALSEEITLRLLVLEAWILGGVALALVAGRRRG